MRVCGDVTKVGGNTNPNFPTKAHEAPLRLAATARNRSRRFAGTMGNQRKPDGSVLAVRPSTGQRESNRVWGMGFHAHPEGTRA